MNWIRKIIDKIFNRKKVKMLNEPLKIEDEEREDFKVKLWKQAHPNSCDGNGYEIYEIQELEKML